MKKGLQVKVGKLLSEFAFELRNAFMSEFTITVSFPLDESLSSWLDSLGFWYIKLQNRGPENLQHVNNFPSHFQSERKKVKKTKSFKAVRFSGSDMIDDVMDLKPEEEKPSKTPKVRKGSKKQKQKEKENTDKTKVEKEKNAQETEKPELEKSHSEGILTNAVEVKQTTLQVFSS